MAEYLLIESRGSFESTDADYFAGLAQGLKEEGHSVTVYLVQNAVLVARRSSASAPWAALASAGVTVLADDFSLQERGIEPSRLADGIESAPLDVVIDQLEKGAKALWH